MRLSKQIIPVLFILAITIAFLLYFTRPDSPPAVSNEKVRTIEYLSINSDSYSASIPLFAQVTTPHHAHIKSAITADVVQLHRFVGQSVTRDSLLIQLDDREAKLVIEQRLADTHDLLAQINNENLEHENELYVIGNQQNKGSKHNREQIIKGHKIRLASLIARHQRANALLKLARLDLSRSQITAPFNGRITQLHVSAGDRVRPGDPLIDMYDDQAIELSGPVPIRYTNVLQQALDAGQNLQAMAVIKGKTIQAHLHRLSGQVSYGTGAIDAIFTITSDNPGILLGQQLALSLTLPPAEKSFTVPATALYGTDLVYKIVKNRLVAARVNVLGDYISDKPGQYLVLASDNISDGDLVMTTQLPDAIENLLVKLSTTGD